MHKLNIAKVQSYYTVIIKIITIQIVKFLTMFVKIFRPLLTTYY